MTSLTAKLPSSPRRALMPYGPAPAGQAEPRLEARDLIRVREVLAPVRFTPLRTPPRPPVAEPVPPLVAVLRLAVATLSGLLLAAVIATSIGPMPASAPELFPLPEWPVAAPARSTDSRP